MRLLAITLWITGLGLYNFFVSVGVGAIVVLLTTLPMVSGVRCSMDRCVCIPVVFSKS